MPLTAHTPPSLLTANLDQACLLKSVEWAQESVHTRGRTMKQLQHTALSLSLRRRRRKSSNWRGARSKTFSASRNASASWCWMLDEKGVVMEKDAMLWGLWCKRVQCCGGCNGKGCNVVEGALSWIVTERVRLWHLMSGETKQRGSAVFTSYSSGEWGTRNRHLELEWPGRTSFRKNSFLTRDTQDKSVRYSTIKTRRGRGWAEAVMSEKHGGEKHVPAYKWVSVPGGTVVSGLVATCSFKCITVSSETKMRKDEHRQWEGQGTWYVCLYACVWQWISTDVPVYMCLWVRKNYLRWSNGSKNCRMCG